MSGAVDGLAQLHFLRPLWLLGLPALALFAWWWQASKRSSGAWRDAVDPHLLPHLLDGSGTAPRRAWERWLGLVATVVALLALAGPSLRQQEHSMWQTHSPLVIALDLSSASLARDMPPSRLAQARAKITTLLRDRTGGQVALVAYAGDAFTVAPLTEDAANVALFLDALEPDIMPEDGQRTDRAIGWSRQLLRQAGFDRGDILVLTDHADAAALAEAARARAAGFRVSALGLGTAQGGVFDTSGGLGQARLDAPGLQRLAASGGGAYQALTPGSADLRALGVLNPKGAAAAAVHGEKITRWRDDGYWLLPLVLLLALPLFRRSSATAAMLLLVVWLPMPTAQAQDAGNLWRRPDQQAYERMQEGIAAYRAEEYDQSIATFSTLDSADGQYNLGNALAKAGRLDDAIAAYDSALRLQPKMADAIANRAAVEAARKRKPPLGKQSQKGGKDSGKQGQQSQQSQQSAQSGGNLGTPQDGAKSSQPSATMPPQPAQQPQPPPQQPQGAMQQSAANAAQSQRIEEVLRKQEGQSGKPVLARVEPAETGEQRERRIANQAQLRRVPDNPGGLLRARFRLEHDRRQVGKP